MLLIRRLRENLDTEGVHNIGITGPYLRIDFFILRILGFKGLFVFMSKNICVFLSKDSGILRIILSLCLRKLSVFMSKK